MRMYIENKNLHHPYITDCFRVYSENGDYVTFELQGEHQFDRDCLKERFKGDILVWDEFKDGNITSYADVCGKDIENIEIARILIDAKKIVCLLDPQISDDSEIHDGLWTSACEAVEGIGLKADGRIELDLAVGTYVVTGQFTLDTEERR